MLVTTRRGGPLIGSSPQGIHESPRSLERITPSTASPNRYRLFALSLFGVADGERSLHVAPASNDCHHPEWTTISTRSRWVISCITSGRRGPPVDSQ